MHEARSPDRELSRMLPDTIAYWRPDGRIARRIKVMQDQAAAASRSTS